MSLSNNLARSLRTIRPATHIRVACQPARTFSCTAHPAKSHHHHNRPQEGPGNLQQDHSNAKQRSNAKESPITPLLLGIILLGSLGVFALGQHFLYGDGTGKGKHELELNEVLDE